MACLVIAEHDNVGIKTQTLHAVTAALLIDSEVHVLVAGLHCDEAVQAARQIGGVGKVLQVQALRYARGLPEPLALLVAGLAQSYQAILAPESSAGKDLMPRVAGLLDVMQVSGITAVLAPDRFVRPVYAGNALLTVESCDAIKVLTVRTTAFAAAACEGGAAVLETVQPAADFDLSEWVGQEVSQTDRPRLHAARVVVSGGRGMKSRENFKFIEVVADRLGAAIGASRAAVDAGYAENDCQVGQSGKIIAPDLYIAVGISGAIQHVAGMKDSRIIVAINQDKDAPIFQVADYGLVADLFQALPELETELIKLGH